MKILEINKFFYKKGGSETYLFLLRNLLRNHGNEVMDFSMNSEKNEPSRYQRYFSHPVFMDGKQSIFEKVHAFFHLIYSPHVASRLEKLIHEKGIPDVAHLHNFSYQLSPSIIHVLKKHKIPIVWTLHDYKSISPNYNLYSHGEIDESTKPDHFFTVVKRRAIKNSLMKSIVGAFEHWLHVKVTKLYGQIDTYIAPSKFMRDKVIEYGIDPSKVVHIYNSIDLIKYKPDFTPGEYYVFVGRLIAEKGCMQLIKAFEQMPDKQLVIVGAGEMGVDMQSYINEHNLTNIKMLGPVYAPEVYDVIRKSKAFILPSMWFENNPMVALEAMALGKPLIGARIGGIPELIKEGETGITYDAFSLDELIASVKKIELMNIVEMGKSARLYVEEIADEERHYVKLMEVFDEVIKTNVRKD